LEGESLEFTWDFAKAEDGEYYQTIRLGERELWRELAFWRNVRRFEEVKGLLKKITQGRTEGENCGRKRNSSTRPARWNTPAFAIGGDSGLDGCSTLAGYPRTPERPCILFPALTYHLARAILTVIARFQQSTQWAICG